MKERCPPPFLTIWNKSQSLTEIGEWTKHEMFHQSDKKENNGSKKRSVAEIAMKINSPEVQAISKNIES